MSATELTEKERDALSDILTDWSILARQKGEVARQPHEAILVTCLREAHEFTTEEAEGLLHKLGIAT